MHIVLDVLDPALLRPGRIDRMVYVGPPDLPARLSIFRLRTKRMPLAPDVDLEDLAEKTAGRSGAEVVAICQEAAMLAMELDPSHVESVCHQHFLDAIAKTPPRISEDMLEFYESFAKNHQVKG